MLDLARQVTVTERVSFLRLDGDLCPGLTGRRRSEAGRLASVRMLNVQAGALDCDGILAEGDDGFGLFVSQGLLCRHVGHERRTVAELVGTGDVFRPWDTPGAWASIPLSCDWNVLMPSRLAILDREFAERVGNFPEVAMSIHRRGLRRASHLATVMGLANYRRVETRLLFLFWHLADRFGSVGPEEITIPLPLTHSVIAEMASLRRPSVTSGLARLEAEGLLRHTAAGWRLHRDSADRLREIA